MDPPRATRIVDPAEVTALERYHLLASLVVPRPIGWISTWGDDGVSNLAPFSYFAAISAAPLLVSVSIGDRRGGSKDTLTNLRWRGELCVNVVTEELLVPMNESSASVPPGVDEFELAGLRRAESERVDAPFVADCPAVLECRVRTEVDLGDAPNTLVIAEVVGVRLSEELDFEEGTMLVRPESLRPVGRLGGSAYAVVREVDRILRPDHR